MTMFAVANSMITFIVTLWPVLPVLPEDVSIGRLVVFSGGRVQTCIRDNNRLPGTVPSRGPLCLGIFVRGLALFSTRACCK